jgi:hypothetical protein
VLPRVHGSAVFPAGRDAGPDHGHARHGRDEQRVDGLFDEYSKKFMLDYNFPPFSVGECDRSAAPVGARSATACPGRAERQSGAAGAGRIPLHDPRHLRHPGVERLQLDGQRLRGDAGADGAGVPISNPVAGISIGLVKEGRPVGAADRHHRRRGPLRRHGLQDRRHAERHHRHPARPEDRRHQRGDHRPRSTSRARRGSKSCARCSRRFRGRGRHLALGAAADPHQDRPGEDRPADRPRRQDDPRHPGSDRHGDRSRRRRHRDDRQRQPRMGGSSLAQVEA